MLTQGTRYPPINPMFIIRAFRHPHFDSSIIEIIFLHPSRRGLHKTFSKLRKRDACERRPESLKFFIVLLWINVQPSSECCRGHCKHIREPVCHKENEERVGIRNFYCASLRSLRPIECGTKQAVCFG